MYSSWLVTASAMMALYSYAAQAQSGAPDADSFIRRRLTSSTILGDYMYIEGGTLAQLVDDDESKLVDGAVNVTLSIPLNVPWTNRTLQMTSSPKAPGIYTNVYSPTLWADEQRQSIYAFGGDQIGSNRSHTSVRTLYRFFADSAGSTGGTGSWSDVATNSDTAPANPGKLWDLYRSTRSLDVVCNGVGLSLGGYATRGTDDRVPSNSGGSRAQMPLPGLVRYDFASRIWDNSSIAAMVDGFHGIPKGGEAVCLPDLGRRGVVMFFGGLALYPNGMDTEPIRFGNLTFYDVDKGEWFWQTTRGGEAVPGDRRDGCSTVARGRESGTYEVFLYAGTPASQASVDARGDLWVLTMPGFKWFKVDEETEGRFGVSCESKGRQLVTVGGVSRSASATWNVTTRDPWGQGVGVFDMTELRWRDSYDPDAGEYESPAVVEEWYRQGLDTQWDEQGGMERFFRESLENNSTSQNPDQPSASGPPIGAIVGATVGGVLLLAIVAVLCWWQRRRRHGRQVFSRLPTGIPQTQSSPQPPQTMYHKPELCSFVTRSELASAREAVELGEQRKVGELESGDTRSYYYELDGAPQIPPSSHPGR